MKDVKKIFNGYLEIKRTFFDELLEKVKIIKRYTIKQGISCVIGPDEDDWTMNAWVLLMFHEKERKIPFWFLIKREKNLQGHLISIGPVGCYKYFKYSKVADNEIKRIIEYLLAYSTNFELLIVIPEREN